MGTDQPTSPSVYAGEGQSYSPGGLPPRVGKVPFQQVDGCPAGALHHTAAARLGRSKPVSRAVPSKSGEAEQGEWGPLVLGDLRLRHRQRLHYLTPLPTGFGGIGQQLCVPPADLTRRFPKSFCVVEFQVIKISGQGILMILKYRYYLLKISFIPLRESPLRCISNHLVAASTGFSQPDGTQPEYKVD